MTATQALTSAYTEKTWWQHLPEDLRWYAARTNKEQQ